MPPQFDHFVCISTQQQVTNLLPALAVGAKDVLLFSTSFTADQGLDESLQRALGRDVRLHVESVPGDLERTPSLLTPWLRDRIDSWRGADHVPIAVGWAGGQKPLATALFMAFKEIAARETDVEHVALYVEQHKGVMIVTSRSADTEALLTPRFTVDALLAAHGFERAKSPNERHLFAESPFAKVPWLEEGAALFERQAFRSLCFRTAAGRGEATDDGLSPLQRIDTVGAAVRALDRERFVTSLEESKSWRSGIVQVANGLNQRDEGRRKLSRQLMTQVVPTILKQHGDAIIRATGTQSVSVPDDPSVMAWLERLDGVTSWPNGRTAREVAPGTRFAQFFELLVVRRVHKWVMENRALVVDAYANLEVVRPADPARIVAEFDVLLVTRSGKLVVLDAKSFEKSVGGERAQESSVREVGGAFATRLTVFPAFRQDIDSPDRPSWFPPALLELTKIPGAVAYDETRTLEERLQKAVR